MTLGGPLQNLGRPLQVPAYDRFIKERFERCLDLYLCPRSRKKRAFVKDPQTLVPKLPKPQDLQPFPTTLLIQYRGHKGPVSTLSLPFALKSIAVVLPKISSRLH